MNSITISEFKKNIDDINFVCNSCGICCTQYFNDYIFLLDQDTEYLKKKNIECFDVPKKLDYCDQYGNFYASGYSLKVKNDDLGSCIFLSKDNKCTIYNNRPFICKIYPYMIHKERNNKSSKFVWKYFCGLFEHGSYNCS